MAELTPFQTVGPFFEVAIPAPGRWQLSTSDSPGERIRIEGTVTDGAGAPVPDALIETWQADSEGRYPRSTEDRIPGGFEGFGRIPTDGEGRFALESVMPGAVPGPGGSPQAPHLVVAVLARGILTRLVTRIYFEGDLRNDADPILGLVPPARRSRLIATRAGEQRYRFDIVLQGPAESVFFDV
jgi:protocatechuate 3,4-dioxygenase alpha subunit